MAGPASSAWEEILVAKIMPIWLIRTYKTMATAMPPNWRRRSSRPHSGLSEIFSRRSAGIRLAACTMTPMVMPMPRVSSFASPIETGSSEISPGVRR